MSKGIEIMALAYWFDPVNGEVGLPVSIGLETVEELVDWLAVGERGGVDYGEFGRRERVVTPEIKLGVETPVAPCGAPVPVLASIPDYLEKIRKFKRLYEGQLRTALEKDFWPAYKDLVPKRYRKSGPVSERLRNRGNDYKSKNDLKSALRCYSLALRYAPKGSREEALAHSNRSACFVQNGNWEAASKEIEMFEVAWKTSDDGIQVPSPIFARKLKCLEELMKLTKLEPDPKKSTEEEKQFAKEFFKLNKPSKVIPSAEDCLGILEDEDKGRGIYNVGKQTIKPGTLLILEKPFVHSLITSCSFLWGERCSVCYRELEGGWIPCDGCVFNMYCSKECFDSEDRKLHSKYECKMAPFLYERNQNWNPNPHLALLALLKLGPTELLKIWRNGSQSVQNENRDSTSPAGVAKGVYCSSSYHAISNLMSHPSSFSEMDQIIRCIDAVLVTQVLDRETNFFKSLNLSSEDTAALMEEFTGLYLRHDFSFHMNSLPLCQLDIPRKGDTITTDVSIGKFLTLGSAVHPLVSLLNHSCNRNCTYFTLPGGAMAVVALEHIRPGQELSVTYGPTFNRQSREVRREALIAKFNFHCECDACFGNWEPDVDEENPPKADQVEVFVGMQHLANRAVEGLKRLTAALKRIDSQGRHPDPQPSLFLCEVKGALITAFVLVIRRMFE